MNIVHILPVGKMIAFGTEPRVLVGEITAVNRTRYVVLCSDRRSYTVPFANATLLEDQSGPKPSDSIPTSRTFRLGDKVVTHAPGSKYHGIHGVVIKINPSTIKFQPNHGGLPINGPANMFRLEA